MKHNEVKAFFKSKIKEWFPEYTILSIDETATSRRINIVDENLVTRIVLETYFGTNSYSVKVFKVDRKHLKGETHHPFTDIHFQVSGTYNQIHLMNDVKKHLKKIL